jgi:hypothetical protein
MNKNFLAAIQLFQWTTYVVAWAASRKPHILIHNVGPLLSTIPNRNIDDFDFSSSRQWEAFYQKSNGTDEAYEWHSSIAITDILQHVPDGPILMIGCGNSRLPDFFSNRQVTLLDSSPTCMDVLRKRYAHEEKFDYICGDVLTMGSLLAHRKGYYASIIDKGLMDAILCGDDWDNIIQRLMEQTSMLLKGKYVLVSYRLPLSTQSYLQQAGENYGIEGWKFHVTGSNDRVGISLARKER